ncbi:hypothetical protein U1Q18_025232 [Sarracenia purpurea var. burkii]
MTSAEETAAVPDGTHLAEAAVAEAAAATAAAAAVSADGELDYSEIDTDSQVDPAYAIPEQVKEGQSEAAREANKGRLQSFKSVVIVSAVAVAVIGAVFAMAKKVKEPRG